MTQDNEKLKFLNEMSQKIKSLELQHSRIFTQTTQRHDADFYMILLRRLYRVIEKNKSDSRVANLISKNKDLFKNIKNRDFFEHDKKPEYPTNEELKKKLRISKELTAFIQTVICEEVDGSISIISENFNWNLTHDHNSFLKVIKKFINLYPFNNKPKHKRTYQQLKQENIFLKKRISDIKKNLKSSARTI